ncbi:MAG: iron-sulfur cluster assembly accessory protein [Caldimonas sp.]
MTITLTAAAAEQISSQIAKRGKGLGLRIGVRNVGCSGFAYTYELVDDLDADDHLFESHGAKLAVDSKSLAFIDGSCLDFVSEGMNKTFKVDNPNVDSTCGCGESFNLKAGPAQGTRA